MSNNMVSKDLKETIPSSTQLFVLFSVMSDMMYI